jgi:hypothetical protein
MTAAFWGLVLFSALGVYAIFVPETLSPSFELSQSIGPIYIEYDPNISYKEFLDKTSRNTSFWYVNGKWQSYAPLSNYYTGFYIEPPSIAGWSSIEGNVIKALHTGNYMYPVIVDQSLPLTKTFLGTLN